MVICWKAGEYCGKYLKQTVNSIKLKNIRHIGTGAIFS